MFHRVHNKSLTMLQMHSSDFSIFRTKCIQSFFRMFKLDQVFCTWSQLNSNRNNIFFKCIKEIIVLKQLYVFITSHSFFARETLAFFRIQAYSITWEKTCLAPKQDGARIAPPTLWGFLGFTKATEGDSPNLVFFFWTFMCFFIPIMSRQVPWFIYFVKVMSPAFRYTIIVTKKARTDISN